MAKIKKIIVLVVGGCEKIIKYAKLKKINKDNVNMIYIVNWFVCSC